MPRPSLLTPIAATIVTLFMACTTAPASTDATARTELPTSATAVGAWSATGVSDRYGGGTGMTWTVLPDGTVLFEGGMQIPIEGDVASHPRIERFDPASGTFARAGSMVHGRSGHSATLLADGRVLLAGGDEEGSLAAAEILDPATGLSTPTGSMAVSRWGHTATLLKDGRALVVGGWSGGGLAEALAEAYDPATGAFAAAGTLGQGRMAHSATRLQNGEVLIVGGAGPINTQLASAEIYDPVEGSFRPTGSLTTRRQGHQATELPDGTVLITGGMSAPGIATASAELYDPATGAFTEVGVMQTPRWGHSATLLLSGRVLVVGGVSRYGSDLDSAELYDPVSRAFSVAASMIRRRSGHVAVPLLDGRVLVAYGGNMRSAGLYGHELFDESQPCLTTSCEAQATDCGTISDRCGGELACGACAEGETCASNQCRAEGACVHDVCVAGPKLAQGCDACVDAVCASDAACCRWDWDEFCVEDAMRLCGACTTADPCEHGACTTGRSLVRGCDPCVTTICGARGWIDGIDWACCEFGWDPICVQEAAAYCQLACE